MKKFFCLIVMLSMVICIQGSFDQEHCGIKRCGIKTGTRTTQEIMIASKRKEKPFHHECCKESSAKKHDEIGLNFLGARIEQQDYALPSGIVPPDTMGAVGPTQFIVAINGRIRSFDKHTGHPDLILDATTDDFFVFERNGTPTSDPRIRYDRFSERWFIVMVTIGDEEEEEESVRTSTNNRIMFAVSDTKEITYFTEWSFNFIEVGQGFFFDQPTLGIDNQALYIGGVLFLGSGALPIDQRLYVVNKEALIEENELVYTEFIDVISPTPLLSGILYQGVDNFDQDATVGYFISIDSFSKNHLALYRVFNPGSESPTLSSPILLEVPQICTSLSVSNQNATPGREARSISGSDNRLMMAQIRDGHLWTTHNIGVNNQGICNTEEPPTRDGARWYEIDVTQTQPSLIQYGTLFDRTKNNGLDARDYWTPSLMTSGQGVMALGCSTAGENRFVNCAIARRFKYDPQGTLQQPILYTDSNTTYNPEQDTSNPLRWGDYSYTSVDPCDDMTIWTIQEYCVDTDQWGVQVAQLLAPPPAQLISVGPNRIHRGKPFTTLTIRGRSQDGSGFFDPGNNFDCRLRVEISGGVEVKKVKYISPTLIKVEVSTKCASLGSKEVKVINPDGQEVKACGLLTVVA